MLWTASLGPLVSVVTRSHSSMIAPQSSEVRFSSVALATCACHGQQGHFPGFRMCVSGEERTDALIVGACSGSSEHGWFAGSGRAANVIRNRWLGDAEWVRVVTLGRRLWMRLPACWCPASKWVLLSVGGGKRYVGRGGEVMQLPATRGFGASSVVEVLS